MSRIAAIMLAGLAAGCAASPGSIEPTPIPDVLYRRQGCAALAEARAQAALDVAIFSREQTSAQTGDAIGVLMFGLPLSSMTGGDVSARLAEQKGRVLAIDKARAAKGCGPA